MLLLYIHLDIHWYPCMGLLWNLDPKNINVQYFSINCIRTPDLIWECGREYGIQRYYETVLLLLYYEQFVAITELFRVIVRTPSFSSPHSPALCLRRAFGISCLFPAPDCCRRYLPVCLIESETMCLWIPTHLSGRRSREWPTWRTRVWHVTRDTALRHSPIPTT